jgi:hypothetical protein
MDAPSHTGPEIVFQQLQVFSREVWCRHKPDAQHVQRFLFDLTFNNVVDAFQYRIQAPE